MHAYLKGAEAKLVEFLTEIQDETSGWMAICFDFSELMEEYRSEYQIKIALNMMKDLLSNEEGEIFLCEDSTIFLLSCNVPRQKLEKVVFQLRYLFMDDPLAYTIDGEENDAFCVFFDLEEDADTFSMVARKKMLSGGKRNIESAGGGAGLIEQVRKQIASSTPIRFFNASSMATIEKNIVNANLSSVLRRQPVCAAIPDMMVRRVFDEIYINIAHLREQLNLDVDLLSNRWLFKYLTEILDQKMLKIIEADKETYVGLPVSLNLNVKTLMSDAFLEFDAGLKPAQKVSIVIEIQISDVFEDMRAFIMARNSVQKLGYRVCLDGLTDLSFAQINRENLGVDLVKLQWNAEKAADSKSAESQKIAKVIKACGANRVILTRCDDKTAVKYGQNLGISLFQGRYLDKLMDPLAGVQN